ncbi:hypothetical protein DV736_g4799, partial [Chaetothyriales sp. CBS 134916]
MVRQFMEYDAGDSRRLSARSRKLTAKAQALSGSRFLPHDSANIPVSTKSTDSLPASPNPVLGGLNAGSKILATSADEQTSSASTGSEYSPLDLNQMTGGATEAEIDETTINESSKWSSRRERKRTVKVLGTEAVKEAAALSRKRSVPPSQEEPRYKMRPKRKPTAKVLDTKLDEALDEYLDEAFDVDLIWPKEKPRRNVQREYTNGLEMSPSRSRHLFSGESEGAPLISDPPTVKTNRRTKRTEENDVGLLKSGRSESSQKKAGPIRHSEPSVGAGRLSTVNMSSQSLREHPKQRTKARRRAGSALAASRNARSQIPDIHITNSNRTKHPKHSPKRRKRETATARTPEETVVTEISTPTMAPQPIHSDNTQAEEPTESDTVHEPELPSSQTRMILTMPLTTSSVKSPPSFPVQVRKAEFVDKGCQLFCLDASSRILAFAEIAAELPECDEDGSRDPGATDSSLYERWLELGRSRFCVCGKSDISAVRSVLTEDELTQILEPNGITQLKAKDDVHGCSCAIMSFNDSVTGFNGTASTPIISATTSPAKRTP